MARRVEPEVRRVYGKSRTVNVDIVLKPKVVSYNNRLNQGELLYLSVSSLTL